MRHATGIDRQITAESAVQRFGEMKGHDLCPFLTECLHASLNMAFEGGDGAVERRDHRWRLPICQPRWQHPRAANGTAGSGMRVSTAPWTMAPVAWPPPPLCGDRVVHLLDAGPDNGEEAAGIA